MFKQTKLYYVYLTEYFVIKSAVHMNLMLSISIMALNT